MNRILAVISNIIWMPLYLLLFGLGIFFTFKTNFFQLRKFLFMLKTTFGKLFAQKKSAHDGAFTPWQAVSTALASTIGTGNIVGVSTAIAIGGPGAVFWMWVIAFFGMMTKYSEIVLAIKYREKNADNEWCGGPMYYIKNGLHKPILAIIFAVFTVFGAFIAGNITQINSISFIVNDYTSVPRFLTGIIVAIIIGLVIIGGMKSIGKITESIVPLMSLIYVLGSIFTLVVNAKRIPTAICDIFVEAFRIKSIGAGALGYGIFSALHYGIARGTTSSEAGIGSAPIAQAASNLKEPVEQGLYGILEVFISSFVICTLTALIILTGNVYNKNVYEDAMINSGMAGLKNLDQGVLLTAKSFASAMGLNIADLFITLCIIFFALSTIIGWFYYGEKAYEFISKGKWLKIYKYAFIIVILIGPLFEVNIVWEMSDIINGLMAIPNLIGLVLLSKVVLYETKKYFGEK